MVPQETRREGGTDPLPLKLSLTHHPPARHRRPASHPLNVDAPVIFTSGYAVDTFAHRGLTKPGIQFLQKPYTSRELLERIEHVLSVELEGLPHE
jgi:hypothetical protein